MDMDGQQVPQMATHGKTHTWILIMCVWTLVMTIVIIGLMMTSNASKEDTSTDTVAAACENGITNAINAAESANDKNESDDVPATACTSPANPIYKGNNSNDMLPKIAYPYGWSAILHTDAPSFEAFPQYIFDCEGCGGLDTTTKLYVRGYPIAEADEMDVAKLQAEYTEASKAEDYKATNLVINAKTLANGSVVYIDGHENVQAAGGGDYDFHEVRFASKNTYVLVRFIDYDESESETWEAIKQSLDFTSVK